MERLLKQSQAIKVKRLKGCKNKEFGFEVLSIKNKVLRIKYKEKGYS
jgi:hypothetical protein